MTKRHIPISIISFAVLLIVQYLLIYNTFTLRNNQYQVQERHSMDSTYRSLLLNDKLFPGGQRIIDSIIRPRYESFNKEKLEHNGKNFDKMAEAISDTLISLLQQRSNMDSIFRSMLLENNLDTNFTYRLLLRDFQITLDGTSYINMLVGKWKINKEQPFIPIDGKLKAINPQNLITDLTVSSPQAYSYRIGFVLHADDPNYRYTKILKQMAPTLLLAFTAISLVVGIYYLTYRNWIRQKKMTDMTSDFLNSITHEFHTPITTISVANKSIENIAKTTDDDNELKELSSIIKRQANRLQKLIKQALNIAELNTYNLEKESYNLNQLITEIINDYKYTLHQNVTIQIDALLKNPSIEMRLNKFLFTTTVNNIFDNAIKYNQSEAKTIRVTFIQKEQEIGLQITDNGIGLDEKQYQTIFQKFQRGRELNHLPGLGLGLFYVKRVVEAHGWKIDIHSNLGQGSSFIIWMPLLNN